MSISVANAVAAYARNSKTAGGGAMEPRSADPGKSFSDMLGEAAKGAIDAGRQSEQMSALAVAGKAELADVVTAVANAEITLQTVVAIRDRVIQAYQEITRMPI